MRAVDEVDLVSIRIDEKLAGLTLTDPECCIFRVHTQLRNVNEKAYEPELLAIGPYHRGKDELKQMEDHKLRYLKLLLQRRNESSVERYIKAMRKLEGRGRRFYGETISLTKDEFVEMLLLDGCFIIELFRKFNEMVPTHGDPIFQLKWMLPILWRDVLLFENQLPFFVLTELYRMTDVPNQQDNLIDLAVSFLEDSALPCGCRIYDSSHVSFQNIGHLLALLHIYITQPYEEIGTGRNVVERNLIPSATELQEAGVKFKKLETGRFLDIKFSNGVMEIPLLTVTDITESMFRNLVAYEEYSPNNNPKYFTEYMKFMDYLINSPKDVELLRQQGIIEHLMGDDEVVSTMFNKLGDYVLTPNLYYAQIFRDVNKHCRKRQNVWMAKLRHNYFNSPWALISVLAAVFLLLLALTQTIFSVLSYIVSKK